MAVLRRRLSRKNDAGVYETMHLETSADLVVRGESNVDVDLATLETSNETLTTDMTKAKTDIGSLKTVAQELRTDTDALQTDVNNLKAGGSGGTKTITFAASDFSSGVYTIPSTTHGMTGGNFAYTVYAKNGDNYVSGTWATTEVSVTYNSAGQILVTASAGFDGKLVLMG